MGVFSSECLFSRRITSDGWQRQYLESPGEVELFSGAVRWHLERTWSSGGAPVSVQCRLHEVEGLKVDGKDVAGLGVQRGCEYVAEVLLQWWRVSEEFKVHNMKRCMFETATVMDVSPVVHGVE